jgi:hypothetical protein
MQNAVLFFAGLAATYSSRVWKHKGPLALEQFDAAIEMDGVRTLRQSQEFMPLS